MEKVERSMEEVNTLLFDDESLELNHKQHEVVDSKQQQQTTSRLLNQKELSIDFEKLEPVPYYKRPLVQGAIILTIAIPFGWGLISAFSADTSSSQLQSAKPVVDIEKQLLKESLQQERKKNQTLAIENGLRTQQIKVIPAKAKPTPKPVPPTPVVRPQQVIVRQEPSVVSQPVSHPRPVRPLARLIPRPAIDRVIKAETKPDPIQQLLLATKAGSYGGNSPSTDSQNISAQSFNNPTPTTASIAEERNAPDDNSSDWQPSETLKKAPSSLSSDPPLNEASVTQPYPASTKQSSSISQVANYSSSINNLVAGTQTSGKLLTKISWRTNNLPTRVRKQIKIELTKPLINQAGVPVIPKGTQLLAKVDTTNSAGQVRLSVFALKYANREPETVPEGAILILDRNTDDENEWLQAKISRKNKLGRKLGRILLSGASQTAATANSSVNSVFSDDGFIVGSRRDRNYPAAFAQGATQELLRQAQDSTLSGQLNRPDSTTFVLPEGTRVRVYINVPQEE